MKKIVKDNFLIICALLYLVLDSIFNINIPCVFNKITGLYCPGCGVTRMLRSILVLDFYQAFRYNPLLFIFTPFIIILIVNYIYCSFKKKNSLYKKIPEYVWIVLLIITILFWILRNIIPYLEPTMV